MVVCLPFHHACTSGSLDTVKHLFTLYPESINVADWRGHLPIHLVARYNGTRKVEIIRFLLAQHPDSASTATTSEDRSLPLHLTCDINFWSHTDLKSTLKVNLGTAKLLFDAYPEAICTNNGNGRSPLEIASVDRRHCGNNRGLVNFLEAQLKHVRQAQDTSAMTTLDDNGRLPLHIALHDKACLGAIKLLTRGNPSALRVADNQGSFPLHIACEFCTLIL